MKENLDFLFFNKFKYDDCLNSRFVYSGKAIITPQYIFILADSGIIPEQGKRIGPFYLSAEFDEIYSQITELSINEFEVELIKLLPEFLVFRFDKMTRVDISAKWKIFSAFNIIIDNKIINFKLDTANDYKILKEYYDKNILPLRT